VVIALRYRQRFDGNSRSMGPAQRNRHTSDANGNRITEQEYPAEQCFYIHPFIHAQGAKALPLCLRHCGPINMRDFCALIARKLVQCHVK